MAEKNSRPRIDKSLSSSVHELIKKSWDCDPNKRPTFETISHVLKTEYQEMMNVAEPGKESRSQHLMDSSIRSFEGMLTNIRGSRRSTRRKS